MSNDDIFMKHSSSDDDKNSLDEDYYEADESVRSDTEFASDNEVELTVGKLDSEEFVEDHEKEDRYNVGFDTAEDITNILSRVKLVWPENLPASDKEANKHLHKCVGYPPSYCECTDKEKVALWQAENFRQQFAYLYPKRRPLYLAPKNECGVQKIFPTFIKPTVMGYPEFYESDSIANFLNNYLCPEILDPPDLIPSTIRSPMTCLKERCSNSFEFALLAASFLIGVGYDAYIVDGYAIQSVTSAITTGKYIEQDEIENENDDSNNAEQTKKSNKKETEEDKTKKDDESIGVDIFREEEVIRPVSPSKYRIADKPPVTSKYLAAMEKRVEDKLAEEKRLADIEAEKEAQRNKRPDTPDLFEGHRVHAWILVLPGKGGVLKPFFLEPFAGVRKDIQDPAFLGIEAVFNHLNYYVNLQDCQGEGLEKLSFNLKDKTKWSKLLYEPPPKRKGGNPLGAGSFQEGEDDDIPPTIEMFLDMPISWVMELEISQEDYDLRYPDGKKLYHYEDAIVEIASALVNPDGMVKKVIKFSGKKHKPKYVVYIEEWFENRKDKLNRRKWIREGRMVYEHFNKGRRDALKEHVHVSGRNLPNQPRHLYYYSDAHNQSVRHREVIPKGIIEHFDNREDKLYYRKTIFGKILCFTIPPKEIRESGVRALLELMTTDETGDGKNTTRRKILRIEEKFQRNPLKNYDEDIAEKHMLLEEHLMRVMFHYGEGCITRNSIEFLKNEDDEYDIKQSVEYRADPFSLPMDEYTRFNLLKLLLKEEIRSGNLAREADDEIYTIVRQRVQEDWNHEIEPDDFAKNAMRSFLDQQDTGDKYDKDLTGIDFTTPYIEKYGQPSNKSDELIMKKRIIYHMRNRIIKQAQLMETEFNNESAKLKNKLDWYESIKNQLNPTEEEIYRTYYKDVLFRMHIIQQRMVRHIERGPIVYYNLIQKILDHPKLNQFTNQRILPPEPENPEKNELNRKQNAKDLEKMNDCCQFFDFRFREATDYDPEMDETANPNLIQSRPSML